MIDRIADLKIFKRIVELGSMAAAGKERGLSPATLSQRLSQLEKSLNVQLLHRTTRQQHLTTAGKQLFSTAQKVLTDIDQLAEALSEDSHHLSGAIRVSAPVDIGRNHIAPVIDAFLQQHAELSVSLRLSDDSVDLTEEGVDIAIRYGRLPDSSLRLRRIATGRRIPVASAEFLALAGTPNRPEELVDYNCMVLAGSNHRFNQWGFHENNRPFCVRVAAIVIQAMATCSANGPFRVRASYSNRRGMLPQISGMHACSPFCWSFALRTSTYSCCCRQACTYPCASVY